MFEQDTLNHHIDRSIIQYLQTHEYARFSELRPKNVDTNLFTYHLKQLIKLGFIDKTDLGYTLDRKGLMYVDRVSTTNMKLRSQPKIITMLLVQNTQGEVLLHQRRKQPYINTWTLPYGKIHIDDQSVLTAAIRESEDKLHYTPLSLGHIGDCYIVVSRMHSESNASQAIESRTLAHIVQFQADDIPMTEQLQWVDMNDMSELKLAPAVSEIIAEGIKEKRFFFKEFNIENP